MIASKGVGESARFPTRGARLQDATYGADQPLSDDLKHWESYRIEPGTRVRLARLRADATDFCGDKGEARSEVKRYRKQIGALARVLAAEQKRSLLVIVQGVDAAGKDGAVRRVFTGVNPQYCRVTAFKEPDREELAHDYLWRVYRALPARGEIGVFNRSHYEDALVRRARGTLAAKDARRRLEQIANIERTWAENGTVIRKFYLHISREEQTRRFKARLERPEKHWKVEASDFADRKLRPRFRAAYEDALTRTAAAHAPWYIIPADYKWYRDLAIAGVVLAALRAIDPRVPMPKLDEKQLQL